MRKVKAFARMTIPDRERHLKQSHPEIAGETTWTEQNHYTDHDEWEQDHDHATPFPDEDIEDE